MELSPESKNQPNALNTKKQMEPYPKMSSRLEQLLHREKANAGNFIMFICSLSLLFFICYLAAPMPIFGYIWGNSLTHSILITAFESLILGKCPVVFETWTFQLDSSVLIHSATLPRLQKRLFLDFHQVSSKCENLSWPLVMSNA